MLSKHIDVNTIQSFFTRFLVLAGGRCDIMGQWPEGGKLVDVSGVPTLI